MASWTDIILYTLLSIFILFAVLEVYGLAKEEITTSIAERGITPTLIDTTIFGLGLESATPTYEIEYLPPNDKKTFYLEEIPLPGYADAIYIILYAAFFLWALKKTWSSETIPLHYQLLITLGLIIGAFIGYILYKILIWWIATLRAEQLGISKEMSEAIRDGLIERSRNSPTYKASIITSLFSLFVILKKYYSKEEK